MSNQNYRCYCLDRQGHVGFAEWIEADTDDEAILKAREMLPPARMCEVWNERRLVAKINPAGLLEQVRS